MKMFKIHSLLIILVISPYLPAKIYQCMDATGQRIFSDKPCQYIESTGDGEVSSYDASKVPNVELNNVPQVVSDQKAEQIRYRMTPAQARAKYCAKYSQPQRDNLIALKQVVLGMYLADVIKVWGAPLSSDGNKVLFQDGDDEVTISLIEGCVINIQRNLQQEEDIDSSVPIESSF